MKALKSLVRNDEAASLVETALVIALIAVFCIASISFLGHKISSLFSTIGNSVKAA